VYFQEKFKDTKVVIRSRKSQNEDNAKAK